MKSGNDTNTSINGLAAVEAYLAAVPEPAHTTLLKIREAIRAAVPAGSTEEIGYGVPSFRLPVARLIPASCR